MKLTLINIATIITIFQALFLSIIFISHRKKNCLSNKIFAILLILFAVSVGCSFSCSSGVYLHFIRFHKIIFPVSKTGFLIGPLLYFYIKSLLNQNYKIRKQDFFHLIPFLMVEFYVILKIFTITDFIIWYSPLEIYTCIAILLQNFFYIIFSIHAIKSPKASLHLFFFRNQTEKLSWLRFVLSGYILLWIINLQSYILLQLLHIVNWCGYSASLYFVVLFLFFNALAYLSWKSPTIFINGKKYQKSGLDKSNKATFQRRLLYLMKKNKPYLDPLLNSKKLADMISIPVPYLSQVLNESFQSNYNDFINQYRIEESKQLLKTSNKNILEIAYAVGFNSKATFNSAFKKFTGQTPKQFRSEKHSI